MKISTLWTSVMFCYIYGDYFWLYAPGKLQEILAGRMEPLGQVTEGVLLGTTVSMTIPSLMIFLSLVLRRTPNRWLNIILGVVYSVFVLITMQDAWAFYLFISRVFGVLLLIAGVAIVVSSFTTLVLPRYAPLVSQVATSLQLAELPIVFWLLIWGAKERSSA